MDALKRFLMAKRMKIIIREVPNRQALIPRTLKQNQETPVSLLGTFRAGPSLFRSERHCNRTLKHAYQSREGREPKICRYTEYIASLNYGTPSFLLRLMA